VIHFVPGPRATRAESHVDPSGLLTGSAHLTNWAERDVAFAMRFDHPIRKVEVLPQVAGQKAARYLLTFDLGRGRALEARIALSTTDVEGAIGNLHAIGGLRFDQARTAAERAWASVLGRVEITAPDAQKRIFYTALYHAFLHPSDIADADGRVRGPDGVVFRAPGGHYYSTLSLWDISRAQFPLLALVVPERVDGIVQTLLEHQRVQGYLPIWTVWGGETWCMIGNPSLPVIAHAVATGFHGFDRRRALEAMVASSTQPRIGTPPGAQRDWIAYDTVGYLPYEQKEGESVSRTLEYAWGDDAVARVATALGEPEMAPDVRPSEGDFAAQQSRRLHRGQCVPVHPDACAARSRWTHRTARRPEGGRRLAGAILYDAGPSGGQVPRTGGRNRTVRPWQ
jgi:predicted alpha-1,2-mannosidase